MKPCDCKNMQDLFDLDVTAVGYNNDSITVRANGVMLEIGPCKLKISHTLFKRFAEWYLEEQNHLEQIKITETAS